MNISLISIHVEKSPAAFPLASAVLKTAIEAAPELKNSKIDIHEFFLPIETSEIAHSLEEAGSEAFGFSVYTWNTTEVLEIAKLLKKLRPDAVIFAGGPQVTAIPEEFRKTGLFSFIVEGEGEGILPVKLVNPNSVDRTNFDFAKSPSPYSEVLSGEKNHNGILWEVSRGCPYKCAFCYESRGSESIRTISQQRLTDELKLFKKKEIEKIWVLDPTFNHNKNHAANVLNSIIAHYPDAHYTFEIRAELMDEELCALFSQLDASLQIGLQSTDEEVLKSANRHLSSAKFQKKCALMSSWGLTFGIDLIYGLPFDNIDKFRKSLDFAVDTGPNNIDIFPLAVLPGTELADRAEEYNLNNNGFPSYIITGNNDFPNSDLMRAVEITSACNNIYNKEQAFPWFKTVLTTLGVTASSLFEAYSLTGGKYGDVIDFISNEFKTAGNKQFFPIIESFILWSRTAEAAFSNPGTPFLVQLCRKPEQLDELNEITQEVFLKRYPKTKIKKYQVLFDGQELYIN